MDLAESLNAALAPYGPFRIDASVGVGTPGPNSLRIAISYRAWCQERLLLVRQAESTSEPGDHRESQPLPTSELAKEVEPLFRIPVPPSCSYNVAACL